MGCALIYDSLHTCNIEPSPNILIQIDVFDLFLVRAWVALMWAFCSSFATVELFATHCFCTIALFQRVTRGLRTRSFD